MKYFSFLLMKDLKKIWLFLRFEYLVYPCISLLFGIHETGILSRDAKIIQRQDVSLLIYSIAKELMKRESIRYLTGPCRDLIGSAKLLNWPRALG